MNEASTQIDYIQRKRITVLDINKSWLILQYYGEIICICITKTIKSFVSTEQKYIHIFKDTKI